MVTVARRRTEKATLPALLALLREHLPELRQRYGVRNLWLFGSYVRGEQRKRSDLDVLVEFEKTPTLLEFIALENRLTDLIGIKVDLVSKGSLRGPIGERILQERVAL